MIRIACPDITDDEIAEVSRVLRSGQLVQGPHVAEFETRLALIVGTTHVVAVSNCTAALHLTLIALGIGAGDEVAVATYSWPASANAISLVGAKPIFVDIDADTFNIDPDALDTVLSRHRVKAVIPVHTFGGMADMLRVDAIAQQAGVPVIEDAACALGASLRGRSAGAWGTAGCFSFHPRKAVTTGEGGAIATNDDELANRLRALRNHGQDPGAAGRDFILPGHNLRLTEFQAVLGTGQLNRWSQIIASRRSAAERYDRLLTSAPIRVPHTLERTSHSYQSYVVLLPEEAASRRDAIIALMRQNGVEVTIGTYHVPLTAYYRQRYGFSAGHFPVTDKIAVRALALPLHSKLRPDQQEQVVDELLRQI